MTNVSNVRRSVWTSEGKIYVQDEGITIRNARGTARMRTFVDGDTTPSVADEVEFRTANTGAVVTITDFDDSEGDGHRIYVMIDDVYTKVAHDATKINMPGDSDRLFQQYEMLECVSMDGIWVCRLAPSGAY